MAQASSCLAACVHSSACVAECADAALPTPLDPNNVLGALGLLVLSGLFSGLTLGLMSLDIRQLELAIAGGQPEQKRQAEKILPLRSNGNLLLCTLLLGNTLVNSLIAILTASFTNGVIGGVISTGFILIFGEIIPQSVCSRYGLAAGAKTVELVFIIRMLLFPVAYPLSKVLDHFLGDELGTIYSKTELKELFSMQAKRANEANALQQMEDAGTPGAERNDSAENDGIAITEATFMCGVLSLSERSAEQIMTKMADVFGIFTDERLDFPLMSRIYKSGFTRIPVLRRPKPRLPNIVFRPRRADTPDGAAIDPHARMRAALDLASPNADLEVAALSARPAYAVVPADLDITSSTRAAACRAEWAGPTLQRSNSDPSLAASASDAVAAADAAAALAPDAAAPPSGASLLAASPLAEPPAVGGPPSASAQAGGGQAGSGSAVGGGANDASSSHSFPGHGGGSSSRSGGNPEVVGLLSAKDLILIDPEDALSVETLLAHCGRDVMRVWNDTPVNQLFKDFTRGSSHLAFVQRRVPPQSDTADGESESSDARKQPGAAGAVADGGNKEQDDDEEPDPAEFIGIVTLEDVLEELIQAEIVDESDVVVDNVSKRRVDEDTAAHQRRLAFNTMLDPRELHDPHLDAIEIAAVASFLAANVEAFSPLLIQAATLQQLLAGSVVRLAHEGAPFQRGLACSECTVVLQGRLHVVCGSEEFESDRGPWTVLGAPSLRQDPYVADFTARVMEPSRLLQISRSDYEHALKVEAERLAAAVRAAVLEQQQQARLQQTMSYHDSCSYAYGEGGGYGGGYGASARSPVGRVACTLAPELAHQYSESAMHASATQQATLGVARAVTSDNLRQHGSFLYGDSGDGCAMPSISAPYAGDSMRDPVDRMRRSYERNREASHAPPSLSLADEDVGSGAPSVTRGKSLPHEPPSSLRRASSDLMPGPWPARRAGSHGQSSRFRRLRDPEMELTDDF